MLILAVAVIAMAAGILVFSALFGKKAGRSKIKDTAYECGMLPIGEGNTRLSVKFYLVAMLFILFDIEAIFLYPWAVVYKQLKMFAFVEMLLFVAFVMAGFFFIWKKGVLDWAKTDRDPVAPLSGLADLTRSGLLQEVSAKR